MLRVGLTGGLGSGKSTAARLFRDLGAHVLEADAIGRDLMQPGQPVFAAIVDHFGPSVLSPEGTLDRSALARLAFVDGRVEELNDLVHPAVIARQAQLTADIASREPNAVVLVESALLFETRHGGSSDRGWSDRFDRLILVRASEARKIARYVDRIAAGAGIATDRVAQLEAEARRRLDQQGSDESKAELVDYVLTNDGDLHELEWQVDRLWPLLRAEAAKPPR